MMKTVKRLLVAVFCAGALMAFGGEAKANFYQWEDSLEPDPSANWWFFNPYPSQSGGYFESGSTARSASHNALMYMSGSAPAWSDVQRNVNLSIVYPGAPRRTCAAQMYIQGFSAHGQLEVIDTTTWTYVSVKPFDINGGGYTAVSTDTFVPVRGALTIRVVLAANGAFQALRADDLVIQCVY